ncbi:HHR206Cp [Eremothecium sinecaudum]|uniref:HHR206Cp n=1 Tax=Eremothecium sinecaudum TaxID=45286 RepID=A0A0X8HWX4_9SACH|nr:HHR206Cp [Eremothecium sinecaudum]AMD22975.1 HHR206Cp [Eremothecium sinecaudum]
MVVHNPNNWHWVDKNCIDWAKKYFQNKLTGLSAGSENDPLYAYIANVNSVEGDCEVNQRKGKVISLFDLKIALSFKGHVSDGTQCEGSITIPEVAFDSDPEDYQFDISIYQETSSLSPLKPFIRENLIPKLRDAFSKFGGELLSEHGNDIQVPEDQVKSTFTKANQKSSFQNIPNSNNNNTSSNATKPNSKPATPPAASTKTAPIAKSVVSNTTTIHLEPAFNVPATELYRTYIDKQRISAWTRSPPRFEGDSAALLKVGDKMHLFGGNVTVTLKNCDEPRSLDFEWRLNSWNASQISHMRIDFHESRQYNETKMVVSWNGIPIGQEDVVRDNFEEFYVRSVKLTFGFGSVL